MRASFSERMAQGREIAQDARNRGQHTGKCAKGWAYQRAPMSSLDNLYMETYDLEAEYANWQKQNQHQLDIRYIGILAIEDELFAREIAQWL